ncbi:hypothetical protein V496_03990 [Pseudogymnoascus sp. VKM F-4515 (FW-2607)]|nr:hypothetical protein V496_03990 [Pseudogymnoascus sp. VKM F-4515 (FW-2607)]KFY91177.1 hypothetical protein V498_05606 [Pseudogymnoascus sp. VKM F-4517 (FW-2822)]
MFSSALKSFSSNISSNYTISQQPSAISGPWKIFDGKNKKTSKEVSIFVFDRKVLESNSGSLGRSDRASASSLKRSVEEVVERLKKEASSLARLRHPNILELAEPVEDTRYGGLQFATEPVTISLAGLLQEKDEEERATGVGGRSSRFVKEDSEGNRRRRDLEIDELEIQKGLLQISKALEFLHENAGLVHGNLTPDAIYINAKSDWKISGLSFLSPADNSDKPSSVSPISLSEVLNLDPRLPRSVQLNLDYASPDFVLDTNLNVSADMFSLGLLIVALYNSPHESPLHANSSVTTYRRLFASSGSIPSSSNNYISSRPIPRDLTTSVLPRLIARRPAQRMTAREFQQSSYFDNILVSTIRFLDALPAKTPTEKAAFMRGLTKVIPSFPKSVLEKKVLLVLLEEMKDKQLLSLVMQNAFKIIELLPSAKRSFTEKMLPRLRDIFLSGAKPSAPGTAGAPERDTGKEAGLTVLLQNITIITSNCSGKDFKDEILPIIHLAIESPTHSIVDAALRCLPVILPVLDFSTIKNELFPVVAAVFSKTSSLGIKVRGLEAFVVLCGGTADSIASSADDGLSGFAPQNGKMKEKSVISALDKYTMQEKIIPLIRGIKTKEPAVMLAALKVLQQVSSEADTEFIAMDILPILWNMSLGPLLDLKQFQAFMDLIKSLSTKVEHEHTKKLQELSGSNSGMKNAAGNDDFMSFGDLPAAFSSNANAGEDDDFERLVTGKYGSSTTASTAVADGGWDAAPNAPAKPAPPAAPTFSWSTTPSPSPGPSSPGISSMSAAMRPQAPSRTITPDLSRFDSLQPSTTQFSQPLQPVSSAFAQPLQPPTQASVNWQTAAGPSSSNIWASSSPTSTNSSFTPMVPAQQQRQTSFSGTQSSMNTSMGNLSMSQQQKPNTPFSLPPPPTWSQQPQQPTQQQGWGAFSSAPPQGHIGSQGQIGQQPAQKKGLDAFESLL